MKQQSQKLLGALMALVVLASCQKDVDSNDSGANPSSVSAAKKKPALASPKLQVILANGTPVETFRYDRAGRLFVSTYQQFKTTYAYGQNKLSFRTVDTITNVVIQDKAGRLNAKGYLGSLEGTMGTKDVDEVYVKQTYTYNTANQLIRIDSKATSVKDTAIGLIEFTWKDGNLVNKDFVTNGFYHSRIAYSYDLSQKNKVNLFQLAQFERLDGFLGLPNANLLHSEKEYYNGFEFDHNYVYSWTTDASGLVSAYKIASLQTGALLMSYDLQYQ